MRSRVVRLLPLLVPYVALFVGGLALTFLQSLGFLNPLGNSDLSLAAYSAIASSQTIRTSFLFSCRTAFLSAAASVVCGTGLAYGIWKYRPGQIGTVSKIGLILPHVSVAFLVLLIFGQTGLLASLCRQIGLISSSADFPRLLFAGNGLGMILAYTFKGTAFTVLMVGTALFGFDQRLIQTARMLGASPSRIFLHVTLPRMLPAMHGTFLILFLYAFGAFDIPFVLGESRPEMLAVRIYNIFFQRDLADRPEAMALLATMFFFSAIFIAVYNNVAIRLGSGRTL